MEPAASEASSGSVLVSSAWTVEGSPLNMAAGIAARIPSRRIDEEVMGRGRLARLGDRVPMRRTKGPLILGLVVFGRNVVRVDDVLLARVPYRVVLGGLDIETPVVNERAAHRAPDGYETRDDDCK